MFARVFWLMLLPIIVWASSKTYVVAFAQDTMANDFRIAQVKAVETALGNHDNIRFIYSDAYGNGAMMVQQLEDFITMDVDVLMTSPNDEELQRAVIEKAYRKGIPVVLVDRGIPGDAYTTYIHSDNLAIGKAAAEYMAERMGYKGTILMLMGFPNIDVTRNRTEAFLNVIAHYEKMKVIRRTGNFLRRDAILAMEDVHRKQETYDAIYAQSDSMLSGVRLFMAKEGIDPASVLMVGIDYIKEARQAIRSGEQDSSFVYPLCGKEAAEAVLAIIGGQHVAKEIVLPTQHVTKRNVDEHQPIF